MHSKLAAVPPPVAALLLQGVACLAALACAVLARQIGYAIALMPFAFLCGLLAALLSRLSGLAKWWLPIQLFFLPALVWMLSLDLPPNWFLAAFLILLAIYWTTFRTQVPLYLSSRKVWLVLETLLPSSPAGEGGETGEQYVNRSGRSLAFFREEKKYGFTFMDLGSGMGGVLTHLAKARPDGCYHGVEVAPLPFLVSWLRIELGGYRNCRVRWGSLWSCDLAQYDVVFAYLSPAPMERLWHKAKSEMRPGTLFVSNTFAVLDHPPQDIIALDDLHRSTLYAWRM